MATLATVRDGLKTRLATIAGLEAYDTLPDTPNVPCAWIVPTRGNAHTTFSGRGSFFLDVIILAAAMQQGMVKAQDKLDGYLDLSGANSIIGAIEGDLTLGGNAETVLVGDWTDYGEIDVNGIEYLGARIPIEVAVTT